MTPVTTQQSVPDIDNAATEQAAEPWWKKTHVPEAQSTDEIIARLEAVIAALRVAGPTPLPAVWVGVTLQVSQTCGTSEADRVKAVDLLALALGDYTHYHSKVGHYAVRNHNVVVFTAGVTADPNGPVEPEPVEPEPVEPEPVEPEPVEIVDPHGGVLGIAYNGDAYAVPPMVAPIDPAPHSHGVRRNKAAGVFEPRDPACEQCQAQAAQFAPMPGPGPVADDRSVPTDGRPGLGAITMPAAPPAYPGNRMKLRPQDIHGFNGNHAGPVVVAGVVHSLTTGDEVAYPCGAEGGAGSFLIGDVTCAPCHAAKADELAGETEGPQIGGAS